jgi:hypothetical protein
MSTPSGKHAETIQKVTIQMQAKLAEFIKAVNDGGRFRYPGNPYHEFWLPREHWTPQSEEDPKPHEPAKPPKPGRHPDKNGSSVCCFISHGKPSLAIKALFSGPLHERVTIECQTAVQLVYWRSILEIVGDDMFNKMYKNVNLHTHPGMETNAPRMLFFTKYHAVKTRNELKVGDWVYFKNYRYYLERHPNGAWQGENAIMVDREEKEDKKPHYEGFGARGNEKHIRDLLLKNYNEPSEDPKKEVHLLH